jgi:hypothetical protein
VEEGVEAGRGDCGGHSDGNSRLIGLQIVHRTTSVLREP